MNIFLLLLLLRNGAPNALIMADNMLKNKRYCDA